MKSLTILVIALAILAVTIDARPRARGQGGLGLRKQFRPECQDCNDFIRGIKDDEEKCNELARETCKDAVINSPEFVTFQQCKEDAVNRTEKKACRKAFKVIKEDLIKKEELCKNVFECREAVMTALMEDFENPTPTCTEACVPKKLMEEIEKEIQGDIDGTVE